MFTLINCQRADDAKYGNAVHQALKACSNIVEMSRLIFKGQFFKVKIKAESQGLCFASSFASSFLLQVLLQVNALQSYW